MSDIHACYGQKFLNSTPNLYELRKIETQYASKIFPGCAGSLDCMNVAWKNCPKSWKGQYHNSKNGKLATVSIEAMCDTNLYSSMYSAGELEPTMM